MRPSITGWAQVNGLNAPGWHGDEYNSHNTTRLDVAGMKALLLKLDFMQRIARGERVAAGDSGAVQDCRAALAMTGFAHY